MLVDLATNVNESSFLIKVNINISFALLEILSKSSFAVLTSISLTPNIKYLVLFTSFISEIYLSVWSSTFILTFSLYSFSSSITSFFKDSVIFL